jgi:hypothetical protein
MRFVRNVLCCRIRLLSIVFCLFRSKLSLHKRQILIRQAGFVQGESRENIFYLNLRMLLYSPTQGDSPTQFRFVVNNEVLISFYWNSSQLFKQTFWLNRVVLKWYFILCFIPKLREFWPKVLGSRMETEMCFDKHLSNVIRCGWPPGKCQHVISMCVLLSQNSCCREKPPEGALISTCRIFNLMANVNMWLAQICFLGKTTSQGKNPFRVFCLRSVAIENWVYQQGKRHFVSTLVAENRTRSESCKWIYNPENWKLKVSNASW